MLPAAPNLSVKLFRNYRKKISKVIFNRDNSRFCAIWKTQIEDIEVTYYDDLTPEQEQANLDLILTTF